MKDGGSTAVKFAKYITDEKKGIGLIDTGNSYFSQCTFVNEGSENGYHLIVPDKEDAGQVFINNCNLSLQKTCTEDTLELCRGDIFKYLTIESGVNEASVQTEIVHTGEVLQPRFSPGGVSYMDLSGNGGPATFLRIAKTYGNDKEFPIGYMLLIRSSSTGNGVTLRNGYYAPISSGIITQSGSDLTLNSNEFASFIYTKNLWVELSSNSSSKKKSQSIAAASDLYLHQSGIKTDGKMALEVPAGYRISSLVLEESAGANAGKLRIGTFPGASDIATTAKMTAANLIDLSLKKNIFSLDKAQHLYISSSNWGKGAISVYLKLERIK